MGITLLGTLIAVAVALSIPKQHEVTTQIALPDVVDVEAVDVNGYGEHSREALFNDLYKNLRSTAHFIRFEEQGSWLERVYGSKVTEDNRNYLQSELRKDVEVSIISPKQSKKGPSSPPRIVSISLMGRDEGITANFISGYIDYTNKTLLLELMASGEAMEKAEIEKINNDINALRFKAKKKREARLIKLQDALVTASKVGVKKPDSIRLFSQSAQRSLNGLTSLSDKADANVFLMGTEYLEAEINILRSKENDDAYIVELPEMLKRINELESLSFDFTGVQLYKLDKKAVVDGKAEKPKRALIVAVGGLLSLFVGLFVALIAGAIQRRKTVVV